MKDSFHGEGIQFLYFTSVNVVELFLRGIEKKTKISWYSETPQYWKCITFDTECDNCIIKGVSLVAKRTTSSYKNFSCN